MFIINKISSLIFYYGLVQLLKEDATEIKKRNFLVYVNPFSGSGKALKMYNQNLLKMMAEAEISHVCIKTGSKEALILLLIINLFKLKHFNICQNILILYKYCHLIKS